MRTLHQSLAGTVILVLLGGLGGATAAQSNDLVTVEVAHTTAASSMSNAETDCPPGYAVVGGGFRFTDRNLDVVQSRPYSGTSPTGRDIPPEQEGWVVSVRSQTGEASTLTVYARCMRTSGGGTTIDVAPTPDVTSPPAAAPPG
ncbi:MAG: hypothetical protein PVG27_04830, partial [Chloroflexota bacterium]